jgi:hypothetical protein
MMLQSRIFVRRPFVTPKNAHVVLKPVIVLKPKPVRKIIQKAVPEWTNSVELLGHSIVYFTLFYCSMNWIYYRNTRRDIENENDKKKK